MTDATDALLETRRATHGDFTANAANTQATMRLWQKAPRWEDLTDVQLETLHMIAHKVSRAICGNPDEPDHWDDIAGYARLCADRTRDRTARRSREDARALKKMGPQDAAKKK